MSGLVSLLFKDKSDFSLILSKEVFLMTFSFKLNESIENRLGLKLMFKLSDLDPVEIEFCLFILNSGFVLRILSLFWTWLVGLTISLISILLRNSVTISLPSSSSIYSSSSSIRSLSKSYIEDESKSLKMFVSLLLNGFLPSGALRGSIILFKNVNSEFKNYDPSTKSLKYTFLIAHC